MTRRFVARVVDCRSKLLQLLSIVCIINSASSAFQCDECQFFVKTFQHGMKQTENAHFGGGNTAWENEKLGKYARSETRLVEVMEYACKTTDSSSRKEKDNEHKCHAMVEQSEESIENWYFHKQTTNPELFRWLCIETLEVCCPDNTYGPNCDACPGDSERPCFGNGKCEGSGTRTGTGKCKCDTGYQGNVCRKCSSNYYASFQNDTHINCDKCHMSCKSGCSSNGPEHCNECKSGWSMATKGGCVDVDECLTSPCKLENELCKNSIGSYECICDTGYRRENGVCVIDPTAPSGNNDTEQLSDETSDSKEAVDASSPPIDRDAGVPDAKDSMIHEDL